jgi:hypothetical protein
VGEERRRPGPGHMLGPKNRQWLKNKGVSLEEVTRVWEELFRDNPDISREEVYARKLNKAMNLWIPKRR